MEEHASTGGAVRFSKEDIAHLLVDYVTAKGGIPEGKRIIGVLFEVNNHGRMWVNGKPPAYDLEYAEILFEDVPKPPRQRKKKSDGATRR